MFAAIAIWYSWFIWIGIGLGACGVAGGGYVLWKNRKAFTVVVQGVQAAKDELPTVRDVINSNLAAVQKTVGGAIDKMVAEVKLKLK